jgi:HTH-type transcriptional regulator, competence development regulator
VTSIELGSTLKRARTTKSLSLRAVADAAEISAPHLQRLERGEVGDPSPHVLYRLSEQLDLEYGELMRLAGYVVPNTRRRTTARTSSGAVSHSLSSDPSLTEAEAAAITDFLAILRRQSTDA